MIKIGSLELVLVIYCSHLFRRAPARIRNRAKRLIRTQLEHDYRKIQGGFKFAFISFIVRKDFFKVAKYAYIIQQGFITALTTNILSLHPAQN